MSRVPPGDIPLPSGWEVGRDFDGKVYFIDHHTKKTTWIDPRDSYTKPQTFADCVGHELPYGWEECYDPLIGIFYVNHLSQENQIEDPRLKWRDVQEQMLNEYLESAQADLAAKHDILDVKSQRLALAKDHYHQLNRTFSNMHGSKTSVSSGSSAKMDPESLKADLAAAKARVSRLKRELTAMQHEVAHSEMGMISLTQVKEKFENITSGYTLDQARAIMCELRNIEESLRLGQQEKAELINSLTLLGEDLRGIEAETEGDHSAPATAPGPNPAELTPEKTSIASQTDFYGEAGAGGGGAQLAELTRLKLDYDGTKCQIKVLQRELAALEQRVSPIEVESDRDRLLLIQEKEQLLKEVRAMLERTTHPTQINELKEKMWRLEYDLTQMLKMNNQAVEERLRAQERRRDVVSRLRETLKRMLSLEKQLKSISASTLSVSSSSSSLGSLSTSSKGSASSLSFTDIYHQDLLSGSVTQQRSGSVDSTTAGSGSELQSESASSSTALSTLHRRVERLLKANSESDRRYAEKLRSIDDHPHLPALTAPTESGPPPRRRVLSQSMLSLSPRSSLSSLSPPADPAHIEDLAAVDAPETDRLAGLSLIPRLVPRGASFEGVAAAAAAQPRISVEDRPPPTPGPRVDAPTPTRRDVVDDEENALLPGMSAAVSDESVAGDSGVYEACTKDSRSPECLLETPQVQVKLWYKSQDNVLQVGILRARNLSTLIIDERNKVCIKVQLFPSGPSNFTCCTHPESELSRPEFDESFGFAVSPRRLATNTVRVNVWSVREPDHDAAIPEEECVGYAQISLADLSLESPQTRWYNVLSLAVLRGADESSPAARDEVAAASKSSTLRSTTREESSDESTIVSSRASTLTRSTDAPTPAARLHIHASTQPVIDSDSCDDDRPGAGSDPGAGLLLPPDHHDRDLSSEALLERILEAEVAETAVDEPFDHSCSETADKETNTECMFSPMPAGARGPPASPLRGMPVIKRSQTFTPSAVAPKTSYICRLNRSDSDSCVPDNRKATFERFTAERKSLRWRRGARGASLRLPPKPNSPSKAPKEPRTSLDLELDLAAQNLRLHQLRGEIEGLKTLKSRLETAKNSPGVASCGVADSETVKTLVCQNTPENTPEEKRMRRILRRTSREIHKLRQSQSPRGQPDLLTFKEKIAFFMKSGNCGSPVSAADDGALETHEESPLESSSPSSVSTERRSLASDLTSPEASPTKLCQTKPLPPPTHPPQSCAAALTHGQDCSKILKTPDSRSSTEMPASCAAPVSPRSPASLAFHGQPPPDYASSVESVKHKLSILLPAERDPDIKTGSSGLLPECSSKWGATTVVNISSHVPSNGAFIQVPGCTAAAHQVPCQTISRDHASTKVYHPDVLLDPDEKGVEV